MVDPEIPSEELVGRVAARQDRSAFAQLLGRHGPRIKGYLLRGGVDAATVEDLTQEVMLVLWRKAASFDPSRAGLDTWLFAIARNRRIDFLRKERFPIVDLHDAATVPDEGPAPDASADRRRRGKRLRDALMALPEEQVAVLAEAYGRGRSLRAISEARGLPLGTVKSRSRLGLARLREILGPEREGSP